MVVLAGLVCLREAEIRLDGKIRGGLAWPDPISPEATAAIAPSVKAAALLGGFRSLVADLCWLQAHVLWERREPLRLENALSLATAIDPQPLRFWLNGARMIAYDVSAWKIAERGGNGALSAAVQNRIRLEQASRALVWLNRAEIFHPGSSAIFVERANICLYGRRDPSAAADWYRWAAELPGAPAYAGRLHAELLRRLGHREEALIWLARFHARLPRDDPSGSADSALAQIRELETELGVPMDRRYPGDALRGLDAK